MQWADVCHYLKNYEDEKKYHFGERTLAYMREKETGKIVKVDQERLMKELADLLLKQFDKKRRKENQCR